MHMHRDKRLLLMLTTSLSIYGTLRVQACMVKAARGTTNVLVLTGRIQRFPREGANIK